MSQTERRYDRLPWIERARQDVRDLRHLQLLRQTSTD